MSTDALKYELAEARALLRYADGLFVGQLEPDEIRALDLLCEHGEAQRVYRGVSGILGLATVSMGNDASRLSATRTRQ